MSTAAVPTGRLPALLRLLETAQPRVLYGVRMTASVALAMWVAFWLQLENAYWAPLTAAIVCQPTIGASLRKGQFRIVGTFAGALAIVVLTALMPQSRIGLIAGLVVWGMLAGVMATILRNSAAYAASLAGYTAVIVFADSIDSAPADVFALAVTRATEISIGVLSAGLVLSATDIGDARRRLASEFARLLQGIGAGLTETLRSDSEPMIATRRKLIGQLAELDPLVDEALGETVDLRYRATMLQAATEGMLRALAAWNDVDTHLSAPENRPLAPWSMPLAHDQERLAGLDWAGDPAAARDRCRMLAGSVMAREAASISERLLLDRTAEALSGLASGANGVVLLLDPGKARPDVAGRQLHVPDLFIALVNGVRVGLTMLLAAIVWIELAWPGGQNVMVFGAVITILFAPQADTAHRIVPEFGLGVVFAAVLAAIAEFAVLPGQQSFLALVLVIGAAMVPAAFMAAGAWHRFFFTAITFIFLALLSPGNEQTYDLATFLNSAQVIVCGILAGLLGYRLLPPVSARWKVRRLLALTLRDVRRFASGRHLRTGDWIGLLAARIGALPSGTDPIDRARLVAGLSAGTQVLRLLDGSVRLAEPERLQQALRALSTGRVAACTDALQALASAQAADPAGLRVQVEIVLLSDVLTRHERYFADRTRDARQRTGR